MKITLFALNASHAHTALSVRCLNAALDSAGYTDTEILEPTLRDRTDSVLARLVENHGDLYGFSCYIWNIDMTLSLARDLKALCPQAKILLGGPEVSFDTKRFTDLPFVDTVVTGEGEAAIVALADMLAAGKPLPRLMAGEPDPAFLTRGAHYTKDTASALVYYESARGCPYRCAFCLSATQSGVRAKSVEHTLADLLTFEKIPGPITVKLVDRTFNFDVARAKAIWRGLLKDTYTKCYHFEISASLLDEECFDILGAFPRGKIRLEIGLQSTNEKTLAAICRHQSATATLSAAKRLKAGGNLHLHLDLIAGLPFEDYASFAKSFDDAYFCADVLQLGFLKLLHGTPLCENAKEYGIVASGTPPYTVLKTNWLTFEELHRLHGIADILDRLQEKGRFSHGLYYILSRTASPFGFFENFLDYLNLHDGRALQKIAQRELFLYFYAFGKTLLGAGLHQEFATYLEADFKSAEVRRPPKFE